MMALMEEEEINGIWQCCIGFMIVPVFPCSVHKRVSFNRLIFYMLAFWITITVWITGGGGETCYGLKS